MEAVDAPVGQRIPPFPEEDASARPLLPVGFHRADLKQLRGLCVEYFPESKSRPILMDTLVKIVELINQASIPGTVWIEGGLLTEAVNPTDFSLTLVLTEDVYRKISEPQRELFQWFRTTSMFEKYRCHNYGVIVDAERSDGEIMHRYWLRQYGFDREERARGVIEMIVPWLGQ